MTVLSWVHFNMCAWVPYSLALPVAVTGAHSYMANLSFGLRCQSPLEDVTVEASTSKMVWPFSCLSREDGEFPCLACEGLVVRLTCGESCMVF